MGRENIVQTSGYAQLKRHEVYHTKWPKNSPKYVLQICLLLRWVKPIVWIRFSLSTYVASLAQSNLNNLWNFLFCEFLIHQAARLNLILISEMVEFFISVCFLSCMKFRHAIISVIVQNDQNVQKRCARAMQTSWNVWVASVT